MNPIDWGSKHTCPECATKFYDLKRKVVACPNCGAKPPAVKVFKTLKPVKRNVRATFGRHP